MGTNFCTITEIIKFQKNAGNIIFDKDIKLIFEETQASQNSSPRKKSEAYAKINECL